MSLFQPATQPALDNNGNPIQGATWKFYLTGTSTLAPVYSDANLSASLGATITSDAAGRFSNAYLDDTIDYRAILRDSGGSTIKDIDPVSNSSSAVITATNAAKRLRTLKLLQDSMARTKGQPAPVMASPPTIGAASEATTIVTGTTWQIYDSSGNPQHADKFTLIGGKWGGYGPAAPQNYSLRGRTGYQGNGTDPTANPVYGGVCRFSIEAPELELWVQTTTPGSGDGIRVKVNGEYIKTGVIANDGNGLYRYIKLTFSARAMRYFELEFGATSALVGVRAANEYKPMPWPQADGLRGLVHGDSFVWTVVDSGDDDTGLTGALGMTLRNLLGQSDVIASGVGGSGWMTPAAKDRNYFNDRVSLDVVASAPDFIIEHGGGNDAAVSPSQATIQALITTWLDTVITAKPETVIFMTGPLIASAPSSQHLTIAAAKQAAAALYPQNVVYIDNYTDPWVFGTGRQGATAGNGNRDWVTGTDSAHPTMEGHLMLAGRIYRAIAGAIPALITANS